MRWAIVVFVSACGGAAGEGGGDAGVADAAPDAAAPTDLRVDVTGETVRAVLPLPAGALLFREPTGGGLVEADVRRALTWMSAAGDAVAELRAGDGELFLDAVTHPSGETTLLVASGDACALRRFGPTGAPLGATPLAEPDLVADPTFTEWDPVIPWRVGACQSTEIRETARLAADGEAVYTVNRGGSHGTVLFRHEFAAGTFTRTLRRPLFPRHAAPLPIGIVASHRVLRSSHWSYVPRVVVDDAGRARVLFSFGGGSAPPVWNAFATTPVDEDGALAILLTVERDGTLREARELPRTLFGVRRVIEIEGLRWLRGGVVLVGRTAPAPLPEDGFGWDGFIVHLVDGESAPRLAALVDLDLSATLSDVSPLGATGWLVAGRSGYWQNPHGASISEEGVAELVALDGAGALVRHVALPQGPRHNGALAIAPAGAAVYVGGLANGPGSHSADSDRTKLAADGWVVRATVLP